MPPKLRVSLRQKGPPEARAEPRRPPARRAPHNFSRPQCTFSLAIPENRLNCSHCLRLPMVRSLAKQTHLRGKPQQLLLTKAAASPQMAEQQKPTFAAAMQRCCWSMGSPRYPMTSPPLASRPPFADWTSKDCLFLSDYLFYLPLRSHRSARPIYYLGCLSYLCPFLFACPCWFSFETCRLREGRRNLKRDSLVSDSQTRYSVCAIGHSNSAAAENFSTLLPSSAPLPTVHGLWQPDSTVHLLLVAWVSPPLAASDLFSVLRPRTLVFRDHHREKMSRYSHSCHPKG
mmetsp:Transcript_46563/g.72527  ORF Transcript_46563/g.72527 Transcript_46563/m.72527 type:complete len:287 (-) Transcript_46563:115-975(-)